MIEKRTLVLDKKDIKKAIAIAYGVSECDVEVKTFENGDWQYGTYPDVEAEITNFKRKEEKEAV